MAIYCGGETMVQILKTKKAWSISGSGFQYTYLIRLVFWLWLTFFFCFTGFIGAFCRTWFCRFTFFVFHSYLHLDMIKWIKFYAIIYHPNFYVNIICGKSNNGWLKNNKGNMIAFVKSLQSTKCYQRKKEIFATKNS